MISRSIEVRIPGVLRNYCGGLPAVRVEARTVAAALLQLKVEQPMLYRSICDETGTVRRHLNIFVNTELVDSRSPQGQDASLNTGDVLTIWTAVSGG